MFTRRLGQSEREPTGVGKRKLFGLDAPTQHEVKTTVTQTVDQLRDEIGEVIDRLVAAEEAKENGGS